MNEISNRAKGKAKENSDVLVKIGGSGAAGRLKDVSNIENSCQFGDIEDEKNKRINNLLAEIDRLTQENREVANLLHEERVKNENLKKMKNSNKIKSVVDRNLQNELKHEKEEAARTRHLLAQVEAERSDLLNKIKDFEIAASSFSYEKIEILNTLQEKIKEINAMESDNRKLVQLLKEVSDKLTAKDSELSASQEDRKKILNSLAVMETEKAENELKFNREKERFIDFSLEIKGEKENIKFVHNKHSRVLASRSLYFQILAIVKNVFNKSFTAVKGYTLNKHARAEKVKFLFIIPEKYLYRKLKYCWDKWKNRLDWTGTHKTRENLINRMRYKSILSSHFIEWRTLFALKRTQKFLNFSGFEKLNFVLNKFLSKIKSNKMRYWNDLIKKNTKKTKILFQAFKKFYFRFIKKGLWTWKNRTFFMNNQQALDDLASDFAGQLVKCNFFHALKQRTAIKSLKREFLIKEMSQADKWHSKKILSDLSHYTKNRKLKLKFAKKINQMAFVKDAKQAIKKWRSLIIYEKHLKSIGKVLKNRNLENKEFEKIFYIWKEFSKSAKLNRCLNELSIERSSKLDFQTKLETVKFIKKNTEKLSVFRIFIRLGFEKLKSSFGKWKELHKRFKKSTQIIKKFFGLLRIGKGKSAFLAWKNEVKNFRIFEMEKMLKRKAEENKILSEHVEILEKAVECFNTNIEDLKIKKIGRVFRNIMNYQLLDGLRKWGNRTLIRSSKLNSGYSIGSVLTSVLYRVSFNSIKMFSIKKLEKTTQGKKSKKLRFSFDRNSLLTTLISWKDYTKTIKTLKKSLLKFLNKKNLIIKKINFQKWFNKNLEISEHLSKYNFSNLLSQQEDLKNQYSSLIQSFNSEQNKSKLLSKSLKKISKLRISNALTHCFFASIRYYFSKWTLKNSLTKHKLKKTEKLFKLFTQNSLKISFKKWLVFLKSDAVFKSQIEIKKLIHEKKVANRANKETQGKLEADINTKEIKIRQLDCILTKEFRIKEFLLSRSVDQFNKEYSENRAVFAFRAMKERYQSIKYYTLLLAKRVKIAQKRNAFESIIETVKHGIFVDKLYNQLYFTFFKYSKKHLKNLFETWKINLYEVTLRKNTKNLIEKKEEIKCIRSGIKEEKERFSENTLKILIKDRKRKIFQVWFSTAKKLRIIRNAERVFLKDKRVKNLKKTLKILNISRKAKLAKHEKNRSAYIFLSNHWLKKTFKIWKTRNIKLKSAFSIIFSFFNTHYRAVSSSSFHKLSLNSSKKYISEKLKSRSQAYSLSVLLKHINTKKTQSFWTHLVSFTRSKLLSKKLLKKSILRAIHRNYLRSIRKWQEICLVHNTAFKVNNFGQVAAKNAILREKTEILEKLIRSQKIDPKFVEKFIQQRESFSLSLDRKNAQSSKKVLPRYFIAWQLWYVKRKRLAQIASWISNKINRPSLSYYYLKWKKFGKVSPKTRDQLLLALSKLSVSVSSQEKELNSCRSELKYMKAYSSILESHTKRGQNLSIIMFKNNIYKTYLQSFLRWTVHCNLCKVHDLLTALTDTEEKLYLTQTQLKNLTKDYLVLEQDNIDLRQASLDGVSIAEAFETLTKEREKLKNDLAERTDTVKKLLEHNSLLSFKLKQIGLDSLSSKRYN